MLVESLLLAAIPEPLPLLLLGLGGLVLHARARRERRPGAPARR